MPTLNKKEAKQKRRIYRKKSSQQLTEGFHMPREIIKEEEINGKKWKTKVFLFSDAAMLSHRFYGILEKCFTEEEVELIFKGEIQQAVVFKRLVKKLDNEIMEFVIDMFKNTTRDEQKIDSKDAFDDVFTGNIAEFLEAVVFVFGANIESFLE